MHTSGTIVLVSLFTTSLYYISLLHLFTTSHTYLRYDSTSRSLLPYNRSLLPYDRSLLPCNRSLLPYNRSLLTLKALAHLRTASIGRSLLPCNRSLLPCNRSLLPYNRSLLTLLHTSELLLEVLEPETYVYDKRDLCIWQKRPMYMAKETYVYGKRDLCIWQKRPMYMAKEAYVYGKRGLCIWQKRPIHTLDILIHIPMSHHHTYYVTSSYIPYMTKEAYSHTWHTYSHTYSLPQNCILCHIIIHTMSHHHTYYVTSSYTLLSVFISPSHVPTCLRMMTAGNQRANYWCVYEKYWCV